MAWDDIDASTWDEIERLTWEELESFVADVYATLTELDPLERRVLAEGLADASLPPGLDASGESVYSRVEAAAFRIVQAGTSQRAGVISAHIALDVILVQALGNEPPPTGVIVMQLPPMARPEQPRIGPPTGLEDPLQEGP